MKVKIVNKSRFAAPAYATEYSAGMDLKANIEEPIILGSLDRAMVPTGLFIELPEGYEAQVRPRSGLAAKHGITVTNAPGTIDADYRGEICVLLVNLGREPFIINPGERIAQMVVARHERVEWEQVEALEESARGEGGFGSTGTK
ncbi:MAG: dUTP diphosphatase [Bacteroidales bacterium]|nr:dUTP diphosphatase [Bacteroidales bacterium]